MEHGHYHSVCYTVIISRQSDEQRPLFKQSYYASEIEKSTELEGENDRHESRRKVWNDKASLSDLGMQEFSARSPAQVWVSRLLRMA